MEKNDDFLFLDLGSGVADFALYPEIHRASKLTVLLSHYHLDHLIGLIYLLNICRDKDLVIYGPGKSVYGESCEEILCRLIQPPYFGRCLKDFSANVAIYDYDEGLYQVSPNYVVDFVKQQHSQPSFGMLINGALYYATDTSVLRKTFEKACEANLLLHECWESEKGSGKPSSRRERMALSKEYCLPEIKLIHANPNWTPCDFDMAEALMRGSQMAFVNDGDEFEI